MHTCMGLAQQLEGKCSVDTVNLFCAEIATKVEIAKRTAPQFAPHKHAPRYQDRRNTRELVTKEKALQRETKQLRTSETSEISAKRVFGL